MDMERDNTIIADYMIGRTRIRISNACVASPEEQERIIKRIGARRVDRKRVEAYAGTGSRRP